MVCSQRTLQDGQVVVLFFSIVILDFTQFIYSSGISFNGFTLKVGRPNDYVAIPPATEMSTAE